MRINNVVKITGLSKRTIYYYIEEQLIFPRINPDNGYYIFSEEDVHTLQMLQKLRRMDFSIKDIHSLLTHPPSMHVYLQKQLERLGQEKHLLEERIQLIQEVEQKLPPTMVDYACMAQALQAIPLHSPATNSLFNNTFNDAKLVSLYLWGNFLHEVPMTEYRQYLWDKILSAAATSDDPNMAILKQFLYALPAEEIDMEFANRNLHIEKIISLTPENLPRFAQNAIAALESNIVCERFVASWKDSYYTRILPSTSLFDSEINALVKELSPRFSAYYHNIHQLCAYVYDWLNGTGGLKLRDQIFEKLKGYLDIEINSHGVLAALFSFTERGTAALK